MKNLLVGVTFAIGFCNPLAITGQNLPDKSTSKVQALKGGEHISPSMAAYTVMSELFDNQNSDPETAYKQFTKVLPHLTPLQLSSQVGIELFKWAMTNHKEEIVQYLLKTAPSLKKKIPEKLYSAVSSGNLEFIKFLYKNYPSEVEIRKTNPGLVGIAVEHGSTDIVKWLLKKGFSPDSVGGYNTPLATAVIKNDRKMLALLLKKGAKINQSGALIAAFKEDNKELQNYLFSHGATLNDQDETGQTLLHIAIQNNDLKKANWLLEQKVNINQADKYGTTPLHYAIANFVTRQPNSGTGFYQASDTTVSSGNSSGDLTPTFEENEQFLRKLLAAGAHVNATDNEGKTPAFRASGRLELLKILTEHGANLKHRSKDGKSLLYTLGYEPQFETVSYFLNHGLDPEEIDFRGAPYAISLLQTAKPEEYLALAAILQEKGTLDSLLKNRGNEYKILASGVNTKKPAVLNWLIEKGANPKAVNPENGRNLLYIAAETKEPELVKILLKSGVPANQPDSLGLTPFYFAINTFNQNPHVIDQFIENGAKINWPFERVRESFYSAVSSNNVRLLKLFLPAVIASPEGSEILKESVNNVVTGGNVEMLKAILAVYPARKTELKRREDILTVAINNNHSDMVRFLLKTGVDPEKYNKNHGNSPLYNAAGQSPEMIKLLLQSAAKVDHAEPSEKQPLFAAARSGKLANVKILYPLSKNIKPETLLTEAFNNQPEPELLAFLLGKGIDLRKNKQAGFWLHRAVGLREPELVKVLLQKGIDANLRNEQGNTPLMQAIQYSNQDTAMVALLLANGADLTASNKEGKTVKHFIAPYKIPMVQFFSRYGIEPLTFEAFNNVRDKEERDYYQNPERGEEGRKAALPKDQQLYNEIYSLFKQNPGPWFNEIRHYTTNANSPDSAVAAYVYKYVIQKENKTITNADLITAIEAGRKSPLIFYYLKHGADPNFRDENNFTPLELSITSLDNYGTINVLLANGANPNLPISTGDSPLLYQTKAEEGYYPYMIAEFLLAGADPHMKDETGKTAMHYLASKCDFPESFTPLLAKGASPNVPDTDGNTPFHIAINAANVLISNQMLERGASVTFADAEGNTPLHLAAKSCQPAFVVKLLRKGANLEARNKEGKTVREVASTEIVKLLDEVKVNKKLLEQDYVVTNTSPCSH